MIVLEVGPASPLVAVGQVDEKPSRKGKKLRMRCGASLGDAERRMPPRVTTTWKRKKRVERSGQEVKSGERERKSKRQPFKKSKETALFKVARGASVARRINIVPETVTLGVTQVDDMLILRSNSALLHKLLSAPERVSGTDRGGPPRLFKRSKDTLSKLKNSKNASPPPLKGVISAQEALQRATAS